MAGVARYFRSIVGKRGKRGRKRKRLRKRLTDEEILERYFQISIRAISLPITVEAEIKRLWKAVLAGTFIAGPFATVLPFIGWFRLVPFWYFGVLLGVNAIVLILWAVFFHLGYLFKFKEIPQERIVYFQGVQGFSFLTWIALYASLMALLASVGALVRVYPRYWWLLVLGYGVCGGGLWLGRRVLLRAIVEGPEAHRWFWPIRLWFSLSVGGFILLTAISRSLLRLLERYNVGLSGIFLSTYVLMGSILMLGLAMLSGIYFYLHYQRLRGAEKLRV